MVIEKNDTVVLITKEQLIIINRSLNECTYLRQENIILKDNMSKLDSVAFYYKKMAETLGIVADLEKQKYSLASDYIVGLNASLAEERKKGKKKFWTGVGVGSAIGVVATVLLNLK